MVIKEYKADLFVECLYAYMRIQWSMMTIEVSDFVIGFVWLFFDEGRFNYRLMTECICFIVMLQDSIHHQKILDSYLVNQ